MKKIIAGLLFTICFLSVKSEEIIIYLGDANHYNEFLSGMSETQFAIKYDTEEKIYYFYSSDIFNKGWVKITKLQLESFRQTLKKYLEWNQTALEKEVKIDKELPDSKLDCQVTWKFGDDWYYSNNLKMYFKFFSQTESRHQFIIYSNKVNSSANEFIDYKIETFYFDIIHVKSLLKGISEEEINNKINEHEKQNEVEDLFK